MYNNHTQISEVKEIVKKLEEQHRGRYSPEQLRAWAHMIQMSKHDSYDEPPDKPFLRDENVPVSHLHPPQQVSGHQQECRQGDRSICVVS